MFFINEDEALDISLLQKMINQFMMNKQPTLQKWGNYYKGKHAILNKTYSDPSKECNRVVTNYCKIIVDTYSGYICGKPISYSSNDDIADVQDVINYNDSAAEDMNWINNVLIYGVGYELFWLDKDAQVRYSQVNPLNAFAVYSNTLDKELMYFVRWYEMSCLDESDKYRVEVYSAESVKVYETHGLCGSLEFIEEKAHHFGDIPVSVFTINDNLENIFNCVIELNDAYNELQSSEIDDFNAWVDSYLVLTGMDADNDDIGAMKENRVLILPDGAVASWLTKNASDTQIVNMLDNIKKNIFKVTACPDMADENFMAQSGVAIQYKLTGFENVASGIVANFTKAIQRRIELICNILNLKASEAVWRDIHISFVRNLPVNIIEIVQLVNALKGSVSDATLLAQIPFVNDVQAELEALQEQKQANIDLYSFGSFSEHDDEDDDVA